MEHAQMKCIQPRPISTSEAAVVKEALQQAALKPADSFLASVESLTVIALCACGCGSIYFREPSRSEQRIADGVGYLPNKQRVDVLVWAEDAVLSWLELVAHGQVDGALPMPGSVMSWERAGMAQLVDSENINPNGCVG
jgi:hypothetical protein